MKQTEPRIDVHNSSKRQKDTCDLVDRISALPDSILGVILSSLPTKNVVSTAFLSKRWKFVWLVVRSLDFYHEGCSKELAEGEDTKFVQFVTRVLHLHDVGSLNKFRLALSCGTISLSSEFKRLVNLEASIGCCHWSPLRDLIQSSHSLEVLTIHQIPNHFCGEGDSNDSNWIDSIEVPRCLSNSLKKFVIDGYEDEREMIHYLLKHGSVLEAMKITCDRFWFDEEFQLLQEICRFPRKSPACEIGILRVE